MADRVLLPDLRELFGSGYPANVANLSLVMQHVLETLTDEQRKQFFHSMTVFWCVDCGGKQPEDQACCCMDDE